MIDMAMRCDNAVNLATLHRSGKKRFPCVANVRRVATRVDAGPAFAFIEQPAMNVIEPERQGMPRPKQARRDFDGLPRNWCVGPRKFQLSRNI
ncbi:hypothetical protein [Tianweitania sediminis]|uniref:hypothetical protein n=1 Tax=Tianweitania sediminis TaxID=1502156 RepID=UPI0031591B83